MYRKRFKFKCLLIDAKSDNIDIHRSDSVEEAYF